MPDDKFWGQYGPGVRRLKGGEELRVGRTGYRMLCADDLHDPKYESEEYQKKVIALYERLAKLHLDQCFDACWRE